MDLHTIMDNYWRAYQAHDLDAVLGHLAEHVVIQFPTSPEPIVGRAAIGAVWGRVFSTIIPNIRPRPRSTLVADRTAVCEFVEHGTLVIPDEAAALAPGQVEPGAHPYVIEGVSVHHFTEHGLIDRLRSYWDTGSFAAQLGIDIAVIRRLQQSAHAA
jgi:hypothetical protein